MTFCTPAQTFVAKKVHRCTYCGEPINAGDTYKRWASIDEKWITNKMHPECLSTLQDEADGYGFEYMPYSGERPKLGGAL